MKVTASLESISSKGVQAKELAIPDLTLLTKTEALDESVLPINNYSPNAALVKGLHPISERGVKPEDIFTQDQIQLSSTYQKRFENSHSILNSKSELYQNISSSLKELTKLAALPEDLFSLTIYTQEKDDQKIPNLPDAHIIPGIAQINISEKLLEVLDYRQDLIEAVIAHEIGHYLQAIQKKENGIEANSMGNDYVLDPLEQHIQSYDEEYQADRVSVNLMSRIGKRPDLINEALEKLEEFYNQNKEEGELRSRGEEDLKFTWIINTHPYSTRRITTNRRVARLLPYSSYEVTKLDQTKDSDWDKVIKIEKINPSRDNREYGGNDEIKSGQETIRDLNRKKEFDLVHQGIRESKEILTRLEYTYPETLEKSEEIDFKTVQLWWKDAALALYNKSSLGDLKNDIEEYSLPTIKTLLRDFNQVSIDDDEFYSSNVQKPVFTMVSNLLTTEWYRELSDPQSYSEKEQLNEIIDLINIYREAEEKSGVVAPDNRYFPLKLANDIFPQLTESDKERLVKTIQSNMKYLSISLDVLKDDNDHVVNKRLNILKDIPNILTWADSKAIKLELPIAEYKQERPKIFEDIQERDRLMVKARKLKKKLDSTKESEEQTQIEEEIKKFLQEDCSQFFKESTMSSALLVEGREYNKGVLSDSLAERTSDNAVRLLSNEDFDEEYFGEARDDHAPISYSLLEHDSSLLTSINSLWRSVFSTELSAIKSDADRLRFIDETFSVDSLYRDQIIAKALELSPLKLSDDVSHLQNDLLELTDLETLDLAQELFKNPALKMTCSFRIAQILGVEEEKKSILTLLKSNEYLQKRFDEIAENLSQIKNFPKDFINTDFMAILFSYQSSSYKRDELLKPWIDNAENEKCKLAIASLLTEPPASAIGSRKTQHILITETLYDVFSRLGKIDKEETLLYLLGHRRFASGIDSQFDYRYKMGCLYQREKALYGKSNLRPSDISATPYTALKRFRRPDGIIELTKNCGCPPESIFKQHRLTSTERERLEAIDFLLRGTDGILSSEEGKQNFMKKAAALIIDGFQKNNSANNPDDLKGLLTHILMNCPEDKISKLFLDVWDLSTHKDSNLPELMTQLIRSYGPVMVKFGQFLSTQDLAKEWKDEFRNLCSDNTTADSTLLYSYVTAAFDQSPFTNLGRRIKEGSIAATYEGHVFTNTGLKAKQREPQKVAVKVYHPFIANELDEDIKFVASIVDYLRKNKDVFNFTLPSNTPELIRNMMIQQIDPKLEAKGSMDLRSHISNEQLGVRFSVPRLIEEGSSSNIVSYEYDTGIEIDKEKELATVPILEGKSSQLRHAVGLEVLRQMLFEGVYQADPNFGNFAARAPLSHEKQNKPVVVWYDPGDIGYLSKEDRDTLFNFISSFSNPKKINWDSVSRNFVSFLDNNDTEEASKLLNQWIDRNKSKSLDTNLEKTLEDLLGFCEDNGLFIKEQWLTVISTLKKLKPLIHDYPELSAELKTMFIKNKLSLWGK